MENIIEKAFDASKSIVRTIFLGKPNLFTTSDLNRQIEAFRYQIDSLEDRIGGVSDMRNASAGSRDGSNIVLFVPSGTYFSIKTYRFPITFPEDRCFILPSANNAYLIARGNYQRKTYADDPTHEIAGAKFVDGTSKPAADQLILTDMAVEFVSSLDGLSYDFIYVIIECHRVGSYEVSVKTHYINPDSSISQLLAKEEWVIRSVSSIAPIEVGTKYDEAFTWIREKILSLMRIPSMNTGWRNFYWGSVDEDSKWRICNGSLLLYFKGFDSISRTINVKENAGKIFHFGWQLQGFPVGALKGLSDIRTDDEGNFVRYMEIEDVKGSDSDGAAILSTDVKWIVGSFFSSSGVYQGTFMGISCRKESNGHCVTRVINANNELVSYSDDGSLSVHFPSGSRILPLPYEE